MEPLRLAFWILPRKAEIAFYAAVGLVAVIFVLGVLSRMSIWLQGKDEEGSVLYGLGMFGLLKLSLFKLFSKDCLFARRVFARSRLRGMMVLFIVWSVILLFIGTSLVSIEWIFHLRLIRGDVFRIYSLIFDIFGGFLLIGVLIGLIRRYVVRPERVVTSIEDGVILMLLFLATFSGFIAEGLRLAWLAIGPGYMIWSPIGMLFAYVLNATLALGPVALESALQITMLFHLALVLLFVAYIPFSRLFHLFAAQITTYAATVREEAL